MAVKTRIPPSRCCGCPLFLYLRHFHDRLRGSLAGEYLWGGLVVAAVYRVAGIYYVETVLALMSVVVLTWKQMSRAFLTLGLARWFSCLNKTTTHVLPVTNPVHNTRFLQRTILSVQFRNLQTECGEPNCWSVTTPKAMCKFEM